MTKVAIHFDPAKLAGLRSAPVDTSTAAGAIAQAVRGASLVVLGDARTGFTVAASRGAATSGDQVVVTAKRDEAEKGHLVRTTASSARDGRTLHDQPQSTTVISAKLNRAGFAGGRWM